MKQLKLDGRSLELEGLRNFLDGDVSVAFDESVIERVKKSAAFCDRISQEERAFYGINTGFGELARLRINRNSLVDLQKNLLRSHATGMGEHLPKDIVRLMMLLRVNSLLRGFSGVSIRTIEYIVKFLEEGVVPAVPAYGSVGASGDLAPLAHMALPLIGEGAVYFEGKLRRSSEVLGALGIEPLELRPKEGLALINGTQLMSAFAVRDLIRSTSFLKAAMVAAAMSVEAYGGNESIFDPRIHALKNHPGQLRVAASFRVLIESSQLVRPSREDTRVQDPYSFRCIPQVLGAVVDTIDWVEEWVTREINAVTDNPILFPDDGDVVSGGNFHGEHMAFAMDSLAIAASEVANISERRIDKLLDNDNDSLPQCLIPNPGVNSGLMVTQYLAASLVSENKIYAHPASVDSIPTSANFEDHVSMGSVSAFKLAKILDNVARVVSAELLCAAQAVDFCGPKKTGKGTRAAHRMIRRGVPFIQTDSILSDYLGWLEAIVRDGSLVGEVEGEVGELLAD